VYRCRSTRHYGGRLERISQTAITGSEYYTPDNAPLQDIFGAATTLNLNLITCGGTFDPATRHYDQRLVVFTSYAGR